MMQVVPFKSEHFWAIDVQPAQEYVKTYVRTDYLKALEYQYSFSILVGDLVVACMGCIELFANRGAMWAYISRFAGPHFHAVHSLAQRIIEDVPYQRLESEVDYDFEQGHRWMKLLGFVCEAERMKHAAANGGDCALYAKVK